jgi:hypothetical protein
MKQSQTSKSESKARKGSCIYRVLYPLCISTTGQWIPAGVIADLSDVHDLSLRYLLEHKMIETADPTEEQPVFNEPVGAVKRKPCPCGK